jgi:PHD/YefM family antitoxin component YafN of YafNO toxin-antitoxin module
METFRSTHLQKHLGIVQEAAMKSPVLFLHHGQPKAVMMSVEEFQRLKGAAGEPVPPEARARRPVLQEGLPADPLGYDTADFWQCARTMAEAALSGRNRAAVDDEIARAERRLSLPRR